MLLVLISDPALHNPSEPRSARVHYRREKEGERGVQLSRAIITIEVDEEH